MIEQDVSISSVFGVVDTSTDIVASHESLTDPLMQRVATRVEESTVTDARVYGDRPVDVRRGEQR